jgi:hypothetical protein
MRARVPLVLGVIAALAACGGAAPAAPATDTTPTRAVPPGPASTFLYAPHAFLLRVDCASIRDTPLARDVSELWRTSGLFARLVGDASFDPIAELDRMVTTTATVTYAAGGPAAPRWRVVLRHHEDPQQARTMLARVASAEGTSITWRERQGIVSALLPGELSHATPHAIVLTAAHEAVIAPDDEIADVVSAARDHAARRARDDEAIEPGLTATPGELVYSESTPPPPIFARVGAITSRASVVREGEGARIRIDLGYPTAEAASAAAPPLAAVLTTLAGNALVESFGLARPLGAATVAADGTTLRIETTATWVELDGGLRTLAMLSATP